MYWLMTIGLFLWAACQPQSSELKRAKLAADCRGETQTGQATWYRTDGRGNCSFARRDDPLIAALNTADYDDAAMCGACLHVIGPQGSVTVRVVDRCPGCKRGDIDLNREAFAQLAEPSMGRIPIRWERVPCDVKGPLEYHFKSGGNQWWTAVQVRNHRHPISRLEYVDASGSLIELNRARYNYFIAEKGLGPGPYAFVVTDVTGARVRDDNVPLRIGRSVKSGAQLRECY